jgi:hypothetical protein
VPSILWILLSALEISALYLLGRIALSRESSRDEKIIARHELVLLSRSSDGGRYNLWMKMVFTWQCLIRFMAYSVTAFLAGLAVLVCAPFPLDAPNFIELPTKS